VAYNLKIKIMITELNISMAGSERSTVEPAQYNAAKDEPFLL